MNQRQLDGATNGASDAIGPRSEKKTHQANKTDTSQSPALLTSPTLPCDQPSALANLIWPVQTAPPLHLSEHLPSASRPAALTVGQRDVDPLLQPSAQRLVDVPGEVGGGQHHHDLAGIVLRRADAVHLHQKLRLHLGNGPGRTGSAGTRGPDQLQVRTGLPESTGSHGRSSAGLPESAGPRGSDQRASRVCLSSTQCTAMDQCGVETGSARR